MQQFVRGKEKLLIRLISIVFGFVIILMGINAIVKGEFGYKNYLHQPITAEFAIFIGIVVITWPFVPKRLYYWLCAKLFGGMLSKYENNRRSKKKLSKVAQRERDDEARRHTESLTDWEKW